MSLSFKHGVDTRFLRQEIARILPNIEAIYRYYGYDCIITSGSDGKHSAHSKHYKNGAIDMRIRHIEDTEVLERIVEDLCELDRDFDVVLEKTHIHLEYDP